MYLGRERHTKQGANLLLDLILAPYLKNKNGIGIRTRQTAAIKVEAQPMPRWWYSCVVKRGKIDPTAERMIVLVARAVAANILSSSTRKNARIITRTYGCLFTHKYVSTM